MIDGVVKLPTEAIPFFVSWWELFKDPSQIRLTLAGSRYCYTPMSELLGIHPRSMELFPVGSLLCKPFLFTCLETLQDDPLLGHGCDIALGKDCAPIHYGTSSSMNPSQLMNLSVTGA
jgi:hypothetical protein